MVQNLKTKIIFINPMGVLTNDDFYRGNLQNFDNGKLSPDKVKLLKNVTENYNVKLVFLETWIEKEEILLASLKESGFKEIDNFFHSMIKVPLSQKDKSELVYQVIAKENKEFIVLDNNTQLDNYSKDHRKKAVFTNIALGLSSGDLLKLREAIEA